MNLRPPYSYIAIEGNIGAGKTTLSKMIAADWNAKLILEQFSDNPFLPFFYERPERYAFSVELFFLTERYKQMETDLAQTNLFQNTIVSDYYFFKTLLFAKNNLKGEEYRLFQELFHKLNSNFPKPELLLYLHRPIDQLLLNIKKRGREFEEDMAPSYLEQIQGAYLDFFKHHNELPILIVDLAAVDFVDDQSNYTKILALLQNTYEPGTHFLSLDENLKVFN